MSQANENEKKLKEPIPLFDLAFSITNVDKTNERIQVMVDIRSKELLNRFEELPGTGDFLKKPDLTTFVKTDDEAPESQSTQADYSELTLQQKLDNLLAQGIIRKKKYDNYFMKINDKGTAPGLLRYFEQQFDLLHRLYLLARRNKMSDDTRATIYKRIMSSKMKNFIEIDKELENMEVA